MDFTVNQVQQMVTLVVEDAQATIAAKLREGGIDPTSYCKEPTADPFSNQHTEHKQTKFYREEFGLVVSSVNNHHSHHPTPPSAMHGQRRSRMRGVGTVCWGCCTCLYLQLSNSLSIIFVQEPVIVTLGLVVTTGPRRYISEQKDTFQCVPLQKGLRALLQHQEILDEV